MNSFFTRITAICLPARLLWLIALIFMGVLLTGSQPLLAQDFDALANEAAEQLAEARYDEALATLEEAYALNPDSYAVNLGLYEVYRQMRFIPVSERRENTGRYLQRMVELNPDAVETRIALVRWTSAYGSGEEALAIIDGTLAAFPDDPLVLAVGAQILMNMDRERGRTLIERALELAPENSQVWAAYSAYALNSGEGNNRPAQIAALDRAIALDPRNWNAYSTRMIAYGMTEQWTLALRDARVLEQRWGDAFTYSTLARTLNNLGLFSAATQAARRSIEISRSLGDMPNVVITNTLAESLIAQGEYAAAAAVWDEYYANAGNLEDLLNMDNAAMIYFRAGQFQKAQEFFERKLTEGQNVLYRFDHEAAYAQLVACVPANNCDLPLPSGGVLTDGVVMQGVISFDEAVWSFEGSANDLVSLAVTVTQPLLVEVSGFTPDGAVYPIWAETASPSRPFVLQNVTLPADAVYRVHLVGRGPAAYSLYRVGSR